MRSSIAARTRGSDITYSFCVSIAIDRARKNSPTATPIRMPMTSMKLSKNCWSWSRKAEDPLEGVGCESGRDYSASLGTHSLELSATSCGERRGPSERSDGAERVRGQAGYHRSGVIVLGVSRSIGPSPPATEGFSNDRYLEPFQ